MDNPIATLFSFV